MIWSLKLGGMEEVEKISVKLKYYSIQCTNHSKK